VQSGSIIAHASEVAAASQLGRDGQDCESPALMRSIAGQAAPDAGSVQANVAKQNEQPASTHEPQGATLCQYVEEPEGADKVVHEFSEIFAPTNINWSKSPNNPIIICGAQLINFIFLGLVINEVTGNGVANFVSFFWASVLNMILQ
jgi:hypothetical protein